MLDEILYPECEPYDSGHLRVSGIHNIFWARYGKRGGQPVVFLHGGPGAGCTSNAARYFDPDHYDILLFDQRGAGRSEPHACLEENTTWDLVADMERLRGHFGYPRWQVFGGSWGSTLALSYAQTHPDRVTALVLRGIFTLRRAELLWFYQYGASELFPDKWEAYLAPIPEPERGDMISAYHRRLTGPDMNVRRICGEAWTRWEMSTAHLLPNPDTEGAADDAQYCDAFARIEAHYFVNAGFMREEGQLLRDAARLRGIPGVIVQGRYDVCCPVRTAWDLHRAWPGAELIVVPDAGHNMREPGIARALVQATNRFRA